MSEVVLDASAILAVIFREPGAEKLTEEILDVAVASTVNLAEVQRKSWSLRPGSAASGYAILWAWTALPFLPPCART